jgi:alpha-ketoglutarate-dependent taurine dioxygenase
VTLERLDWSCLDPTEREERLAAFLAADRRRGFEPSQPPLARLTLVRLGERTDQLIWSCHHLVIDGWSVPILVREVLALYEQLSTGALPTLERPRPFREFIAWLQGQDTARAEAYWREVLAGFTQPVPVGAPRRPGAAGGRAELRSRISADATRALSDLARRYRITLATLAAGSWALLLGHRGGCSDVVFGTVVSGRPAELRGSQGMVGMFVSLLPARFRIEPHVAKIDWFADLQESQAEAQTYAYAPLSEIRRWSQVPLGLPLFESTFAFNNYPAELPLARHGGGLALGELREIEATAYALDLTVGVGVELSLRFMYDRDRFSAEEIEELSDSFSGLLTALAARPAGRLAELSEELSRRDHERHQRKRGGQRMSAFSRFREVKPKALDLSTAETITRGYLDPEPQPGLPLVIRPALAEVDLHEWLVAHRELLVEDLEKHGAVLFRGFDIDTTEAFERLAAVIAPGLFKDNGEHVPLAGNVFTPVFYAPERKLLWHNENSFNHAWPRKILFCCAKPATTGGETPIVDSRRVYEQIKPRVRQRFEETGILYVRNYGTGLGLDWRQVFRTDSKEEVERQCREDHVELSWKGDRLRTRAVRAAVARHPGTGEISWFNQAQHWHISCLDPSTRESAETLFAEEDLPRNCYYGDGSPIDDRDMAHILSVYARLESVFTWQKGDVMVVDNLLAAHARNPFTGERRLLVSMGEMASFDQLPAITAVVSETRG